MGSQPPKALPWTGDIVLTGLRAKRVVPVRGGARLEIVTTSSTGAEAFWAPGYVPPANSRELVDVAGWRTFRQLAYAGDTDLRRGAPVVTGGR